MARSIPTESRPPSRIMVTILPLRGNIQVITIAPCITV